MVSFQNRVEDWFRRCFPPNVCNNEKERSHRFIEEALELVQSRNLPKEDVLMLVDYVYSRPMGEEQQEVGGVLITLAALCCVSKINLESCGETELNRVWQKINTIREKQTNKPKGSLSQ